MSYMLVMHRCKPDVNDLYLDVRYAANIEIIGATWVWHPTGSWRWRQSCGSPCWHCSAKEPAHGYELKLALEQTFGAAYPSPNIGQIYVTLKRLESDGLVRSEDVEQTTRPNKRVYELTPAGRDMVAAWVEEPSDGPRIRDEFFAKLILAPRAGLADQMELINKQRHHYYRLMRGLNELQDSAGRQDTAARLMVEGTRLHLQADLDWLERCQEELV